MSLISTKAMNMGIVVLVTGRVLLAADKENGRLHLVFPDVDWRHPQMERHAPFLVYKHDTETVTGIWLTLEGWTLDLGGLADPGRGMLPGSLIGRQSQGKGD